MTLPALTIAPCTKAAGKSSCFSNGSSSTCASRNFSGQPSENAVKTQVWCAIATYVLIAIAKKELQLDASLYTCLQILSVSVFEKMSIQSAILATPDRLDDDDVSNQLELFTF